MSQKEVFRASEGNARLACNFANIGDYDGDPDEWVSLACPRKLPG